MLLLESHEIESLTELAEILNAVIIILEKQSEVEPDLRWLNL